MTELYTSTEIQMETVNSNVSVVPLDIDTEMNLLTHNNLTYDDTTEYIFDRTDVKAIFLTLYTVVFCSCFFGNLMVILVVTLHWRMRSITNFCLANLAFADLCVGIFCVYQHIITYMMDSWIFGEFMCKMYHFISSLSTTASVLILVVICIERYLAIIHPMRCKQMLTLNRLRFTIISVWIISALISSPRFYYFGTMSNTYPDGKVEIVCIPNRLKYDSRTVDMMSMVLLFVTPLVVITVLYFRIGVALWKSSNASMPSASTSAESSSSSCRCDSNAGVPNSSTPSPGPSSSRKRTSFFPLAMNCLRCKSQTRRRQRRSSGSFYGGDKLGYKPVNVNLTTMNGIGIGNGNCPSIHGSIRNTNGLIISSNGNSSLQPIKSTSLLESVNMDSTINQVSGEPNHLNSSTLHCCTCTSTLVNRGSESVPVSPYLKRDSTPMSSPPAASISTTDPIVLVKFEKKSSLRKCKRNQCTILMRSAVSTTALDSDGYSSENGNCTHKTYQNGNGYRHGTYPNAPETYEDGCCSYNEGSLSSGTPAAGGRCQICEKNHCDDLTNSHDLYPQLGHDISMGSGVFTTSSTLTGEKGCGCDRNLEYDLHSNLLNKDSIQIPHHHLSYGHGHQCPPMCKSSNGTVGVGPANSTLKGINVRNTTNTSSIVTIKGPKRMRVIRSSKYGTRALQCRRRIIKMLICIVLIFALSHCPLHARKIWTYYGKGFVGYSVFSSLFTPITFLIMYAQSGINPILYAFMSRKFRNSFADLLCCNMRRSLKISRNFSVRSTNAIQLSQAA